MKPFERGDIPKFLRELEASGELEKLIPFEPQIKPIPPEIIEYCLKKDAEDAETND